MLSCREASRLLSEELDAPLPLRDRMGLRLHLMMCDGCRNLGGQLRQLRGFAQAYRRGPLADRAEEGGPPPPGGS